ncbi:MAG: hypothetical protein F6K19_18170 [Cyanothece sp. SIO1E1]|nr:hypothetical protein [Cyanothece sp. SIO1E1]
MLRKFLPGSILVAIAPLFAWVGSNLALSEELNRADVVSIEHLPNANYRYVTGKFSGSGVTDEDLIIVQEEELRQSEGHYFLFRKMGNQIVGTLHHIPSGAHVCISGQVNGNTITGQAVERIASPFQTIAVISSGTDFTGWDAEQNLQVRQGIKTGIRIQYGEASLSLNGFYRINAGMRSPPQKCA